MTVEKITVIIPADINKLKKKRKYQNERKTNKRTHLRR